MTPPPKSDRAAPLLLLLLFLISMYCLRQWLHDHGSWSVLPPETHYVQVGGDVIRPGVHAFPREPSMQEVIARAGIQSSSERDAISPMVLSSGERLEVRREGDQFRFLRGEMSGFFKMTLGIPISVNTETEAGLSALPDIGPGLAKRIVEAREKKGGFTRLEELATVTGIGERRLLKIKPYIKL